MADQPTSYDATDVEIDQHRWHADIRIYHPDGRTTTIRACADNDHSGLWLGDPSDHEDHG